MLDYGQRLKHALHLRNSDTRGLADAVGVTYQTVQQVLVGRSKALNAENSARAARFLGVDHYWLATGDGEPVPAGGDQLRDGSSHHSANRWPFEGIPPTRYYALTPGERADIETRLALEVELAERKRPQKNRA